MNWNDEMADFSTLVGRTLVNISASDEEIIFACDDGTSFRMHHWQDCCESVTVEDVNGDWEDLIGTPILVADERTETGASDYESSTWTFYTLRTIKGSVDIRWFGTSNGYYSESVSFDRISS